MNNIVYVSGTFDLFHSNHLKMIEYARGLGEILIVGVSTDELVCSYKKPPAIPYEERIEIIRALKMPDIVVPQDSLDYRKMAKNLNWDIFVVGDDWEGKFDYLKEMGIKCFYFPYGKGVTTSNLKKKIHQDYERLIAEVDNHDIPDVVIKNN